MTIKETNPNFIIVRINKQAQKERKEKVGNLYNSATVFGTRGMQCGEIVSMGMLAKLVLPNAKIGDTLFFSWKVEYAGLDAINLALIESDEVYNYYTVTISEYKSRESETFAHTTSNNDIITHPSYVLLEVKEEETNVVTQTASGLFVFEQYRPSDSEIMQKIDFNMTHIQSLANTYAMQSQRSEDAARQTKEYITQLETENKGLSALLHDKERFEKYTVAYCNPLHDISKGQQVYAWNIMCLEKIEINGKDFIISKYDHTGAI